MKIKEVGVQTLDTQKETLLKSQALFESSRNLFAQTKCSEQECIEASSTEERTTEQDERRHGLTGRNHKAWRPGRGFFAKEEVQDESIDHSQEDKNKKPKEVV